jgi:hypothetical protein
MHYYCTKCKMWLPDDVKECPVCGGAPTGKRTPMEKLYLVILGVGVALIVLGVLFPGAMFRFIEAIDVEFVEITNGSEAFVRKLELGNDTSSIGILVANISDTIVGGMNSTAVRPITDSRTKEEDPNLKRVDTLTNYVTANIRYKESREYTDTSEILRRFSGDDRSHVILLASLFNESRVEFRIDLVEEKTKDGNGFHYRLLVAVDMPEEEVRKTIVKRIRKKRSGLTGTKAKVWYVQDGGVRWYVIDTTGQTIKRKDALVDTSWIFIGASDRYYANRSHYSFDLRLG